MPFDSNTLYYGDNLDILRKYIPDESVDLIYLDPPFNSKADYNILFKEKSGKASVAQIQAFSDFWQWDIEAKHAYDYLATHAPSQVADLATALYSFLGKNDMLAYLVMMGIRLLELHRVLKPSGSIFLHCDPTSNHYLRILMDAIFGTINFRNEISWRRSHPKGHAFTRFASDHDTVLLYAKDSKLVKWKMSYKDYDPEKVRRIYRYMDKDGRAYTLDNLLNPNLNRPNLTYDFKGTTRVWRWTKERMLKEDARGRIVVPRGGKGVPRYKRYLDEQEGVPIDDFWDDIDYVKGSERLGYPTQKPIALLERIINAASDENDLVLDPFCGCGTAIVAAEKLHRRWIGIDITYLAINLVKGRLKDSFPEVSFKVEGEPRDMGAARALAPNRYQFQWWALSLIDALPVGATKARSRIGKKGADEGVDGWLRFMDKSEGHYEKVVVQVKSGHVGIKDIRELRDVVTKQKAAIGIFITLEEPTSEMVKEVKATDPYVSPLWKHEYPKIQILTIEQLLMGERPKTPSTISPFLGAKRLKKADKTIATKLDHHK